jgi:hypothetical protein
VAKPPKPPKQPPAAPAAAQGFDQAFDAETRRAQMRLAKLRDKLAKALDDPAMRAQIVGAIRRMLNEGR